MIDDTSLGAVRDALDVSSVRHQVLANNIANARTPGFHASDVSFGARVQELREGGGVAPRTGVQSNGVAFVDVQHEIAQMTDNAIRYQSLAQLAAARVHLMQMIVHDGRR